MRAHDLVEPLPLVTRDTDGVAAVKILAGRPASGVVVQNSDGVVEAVVSGDDLLRLVVPRYVLDDPRLAHVYDEAGAEELVSRLRGRTVGDLLDDQRVHVRPVPSAVLPEDTVMEIAALMCAERLPMVLVRDRSGHLHGGITLSRLLGAVLDLCRSAQ
jgi:CBS domain-containing protein